MPAAGTAQPIFILEAGKCKYSNNRIVVISSSSGRQCSAACCVLDLPDSLPAAGVCEFASESEAEGISSLFELPISERDHSLSISLKNESKRQKGSSIHRFLID